MANRLAELESTLIQAHRRRTMGMPPPPPMKPMAGSPLGPTAAAYARGLSGRAALGPRRSRCAPVRGLAAIDYTVPGAFNPLAQPSANACWATVYAMLLQWRRQESMRIEDAVAGVGQRWLEIFRADTGLMSSDKPDFLAAAGLVAEPAQAFSVGAWEQLLRNFGPLWVTTDEAPGKAWAIHARLIIGIRGDGTPEGTSFTIVDPAGGRQYQESVADFVPKYEAEVRRTGYMRVQVVHWSSDARSEMRALTFAVRRAVAPRFADTRLPARRLTYARSDGAAMPADVATTVAQLRGQGVSDDEMRQFLQQIGSSYTFALDARRGVTVALPGGRTLEGWQGELLVAAIAGAAGPVGSLVPGLRMLANRAGVTVGLGPAVTGGVGAGGSFGLGVMFAPGNRVGFYGNLAGVAGAIAGISGTMQVTIVHGGPEVFGGTALAVGVSGGEGVVGGAHALLQDGRFVGVTLEVGVGAGLSPIEFFAQYQYTPTTLALAYASDDVPLAPATGGRSIGEDALQTGDIILSTTSDFVSGGIRVFTGSPVSHSALYIGNGQVVEAVGDGVVLRSLGEALGDDSVAVAFRSPGLTETQALMMRDFAGQQLGQRYNYWGVVRHAPLTVERRLCETLPEPMRERCLQGALRVHLGTPSNDRFFCSQLVAAAYQNAGVSLTETEPQWVSPADLARLGQDGAPEVRMTRTLEYVGHLKA
jgi:cell wall-associated NlpC family hydrolase